jgi:hypothetical protein
MPQFHEWESFYVIVGAAAGALIGLQFVVITLISERPLLRLREAGIAFATPTIVHFTISLLLSALMRAPWPSIDPAAVLWGLTGLCGFGYTIVVIQRMRTQSVYSPVLEDWVFHALLPLAAYAALGLSAIGVHAREGVCLFVVAGVALLLLLFGIHNAWDAVTYHIFVRMQEPGPEERKEQ